MRRFVSLFIASVAGVFITSCGAIYSATSISNDRMMREATLESLSLQNKQQIESVVSEWYGDVKVTIASNAFNDASTISIERKTHEDERALPIDGRHNNQVISFTLFRQAEMCLLRNDQTGAVSALTNVSCTY